MRTESVIDGWHRNGSPTPPYGSRTVVGECTRIIDEFAADTVRGLPYVFGPKPDGDPNSLLENVFSCSTAFRTDQKEARRAIATIRNNVCYNGAYCFLPLNMRPFTHVK